MQRIEIRGKKKESWKTLLVEDQVIIAQDDDDIDYMMRKLLIETYALWGLNINFGKRKI